jgi:predicted small lipoprotein YifL
MPRLLAILLATTVSACGMRGPLVLPPGPAPEPVLGSIFKQTPARPQPPATGQGDGSTVQETRPE